MRPEPAVGVSPSLEQWTARARAGLLAASSGPAGDGIPGTRAEGQLIRPLAALAGLAPHGDPPPGFWDAALAVQLAHEASIVHDDIVDGALLRRGEATLQASAGLARALVHGDHLLTAAYRAAARTGSLAFVALFARAVERTVAGELEQGRSTGAVLDRVDYERIAMGKAGELIGCALAASAVLEDRPDAGEIFELGRRVGLLYQMLDDLLDYCPGAETGKPALGDYRQRRWTWVLEEAPDLDFGRSETDVMRALHAPAPGGSPMARALARLKSEERGLRDALAGRLHADGALGLLLSSWVTRASRAVERESEAHLPPSRDVPSLDSVLRDRTPHLSGVYEYLGAHSRSFRFATRFFPREDAARVARVYAFCRITDDLVDRPHPGADPEQLLDRWVELARGAYAGQETGIETLDAVMAEMAARSVPLQYAVDLADGMRMDLRGERYETALELRRYTYRVASVVGLWVTRLFGVHDPAVLRRAESLGHAMQLTNILRDVGEDRSRGRLYLPATLMGKHAVSESMLDGMRSGGEIGDGYRALIEELMGEADHHYEAALEAVPLLPDALARPVAVAAHVYRGIHREIRARGFDNLTQRAFTPPLTRGALALRALWWLHRSSRRTASAATGVMMPARISE